MSTILEKIKNNTDSCLNNPSLLSEYLVILASNIGKADEEKFLAEIAYAKKWLEVKKEGESDKHTDTRMKLEPEFLELRSKESLVKVLLQTIQAIKKRLNFLAVEYQQLT